MSCFFIRNGERPKIVVVFIYPLNGADGNAARAKRFLETYRRFPPGIMHDTVVVCNGGPVNDATAHLFSPLPNLKLIQHDDSGMDIGGYQLASRMFPCDMMVFLGGNSYCRRMGWLNRMYDVFRQHGDCLYGATGNQGDMRVNVYPHVRTTGFWCSPELMNTYPIRVTHNSMRYEFEHGASGLTTWVLKSGRKALIVSWSNICSVHDCNMIPNGFRTGDGSNVLIGDRMTDPPYGPG